MKNYYDELEVSKVASKEVIEKVYKVLAKKYHPDTTRETDKKAAEEKFKVISKAYEILSDDEKRKKYDLELKQFNHTISYEEYINIVKQRDSMKAELDNLKSNLYGYTNQNYTNYNQYYNNPNNFNQTNSGNTYNNYQNSNTNTKSQKKTYYYTDTGEPASVFAYYIYKLKELFSNIVLLILSIIAAVLFFNAIL